MRSRRHLPDRDRAAAPTAAAFGMHAEQLVRDPAEPRHQPRDEGVPGEPADRPVLLDAAEQVGPEPGPVPSPPAPSPAVTARSSTSQAPKSPWHRVWFQPMPSAWLDCAARRSRSRSGSGSPRPAMSRSAATAAIPTEPWHHAAPIWSGPAQVVASFRSPGT